MFIIIFYFGFLHNFGNKMFPWNFDRFNNKILKKIEKNCKYLKLEDVTNFQAMTACM